MKRDDVAEQATGWFDVADISADVERRTVRSGLLVATGQIAKTATSIATVIVLSHLLIPQTFGIMATAAPLVAFLTIFQKMGLGSAAVRSEKLSAANASGLFWANVGVNCALALLLLLCAPAVADFFDEPALTGIVRALSAGFVLTGLAVQHLALLRRRMLFRRVIGIEICAALCGLAAGVGLALAGADYWALVGMNLTLPLVTAIGAWACCSWRPTGIARSAGLGSLLRFGGQITVSQILDFVRTNADKVLIAKIHGTVSLGLYDRAYRLLLFPMLQVGLPISSVMLPALSRVQDRPELFRSLFRQAMSLSVFLILPVAAIAVFNAEFLITFLLGPRWLQAAEIFRFLGLATLSMPVNFCCGFLYVAAGKGRQIMLWSAILCAGALLAYAISAPHGVEMMALAYAITVIALMPVQIAMSVTRTAVSQADIYLPYLRILAAAVAAGWVSRAVGDWLGDGVPRVVVFSCLAGSFGLVYGFLSLFVFRFRHLFRELYTTLRLEKPSPA